MIRRLAARVAVFSTKIHLKTDFGGLPIALHLTGGEASDSRNFETLLDIGPDLNPRAALGDKGYDSKSNRDAARQRGICPAIPYRSNTKNMPAFSPKTTLQGTGVPLDPGPEFPRVVPGPCPVRFGDLQRPHRQSARSPDPALLTPSKCLASSRYWRPVIKAPRAAPQKRLR